MFILFVAKLNDLPSACGHPGSMDLGNFISFLLRFVFFNPRRAPGFRGGKWMEGVLWLVLEGVRNIVIWGYTPHSL